jgi:hypothetical protein
MIHKISILVSLLIIFSMLWMLTPPVYAAGQFSFLPEVINIYGVKQWSENARNFDRQIRSELAESDKALNSLNAQFTTSMSLDVEGPVAVGTAQPMDLLEGCDEPGQGIITFSHANSYHTSELHKIVDYQWLFDVVGPIDQKFDEINWSEVADNGYSLDGKAFHTTSVDMKPVYTYFKAGTYTAALRVVDNSNPSISNLDLISGIHVAAQQQYPPEADSGGPYSIKKGEPLFLNGTMYDRNLSCNPSEWLIAKWYINNDSTPDFTKISGEVPWALLQSLSLPINQPFNIRLVVIDSTGFSVQVFTILTILDQTPPDQTPPNVIIEFTPNGNNGWFSQSPAIGSVTITDDSIVSSVDCTVDSQYLPVEFSDLGKNIVMGTVEIFGDGLHNVSCTAIDNSGNSTSASFGPVKVDTLPPCITVNTPQDYAILTTGASIDYTAIDALSGITSLKSILDNGTTTGPVTSGFKPEPGVYTLLVQAVDFAGNQVLVKRFFVIYNPEGGFVTGGGWIFSPEGAYLADLAIEGKASFGFVSKYKKGASVPDGNTEFQFQAGDLNFHSTSYQWLVVNQNYTNAQFKGYGTINGTGNYGFMLWAMDGKPDTFRIKIWNADNDAVVYDNGLAQPISGGNIVVHK